MQRFPDNREKQEKTGLGQKKGVAAVGWRGTSDLYWCKIPSLYKLFPLFTFFFSFFG